MTNSIVPFIILMIWMTVFLNDVKCASNSYAFLEVRQFDVQNNLTSSAKVCVNHQEFQSRELPASPSLAKPLYAGWWTGDPNSASADICLPTSQRFDSHQLVFALFRTQWEEMSQSCQKFAGFNKTNRLLDFQVNIAKTAGNVSNFLFLLERGKSNYYGLHNYLFSSYRNPEINDSDPIQVFYIYRQIFDEQVLPLLNKIPSIGPEQPAQMFIYRPEPPPFDACTLIVLIMSLCAIYLGSIWSIFELNQSLSLTSTNTSRSQSNSTQQTAISINVNNDDVSPCNGEQQHTASNKKRKSDESIDLAQLSAINHCCYVGILLVFVVAVLMLSFYFREYAIWFFNIALCLLGTWSVFSCFYALYCRLFGDKDVKLYNYRATRTSAAEGEVVEKNSKIRKWLASLTLVKLLLFAASATLCVVWFINRNHPNAFFLLNTINLMLCIHVIKAAKIRSLRLLTFLLLAMFVYDLFMVFGTKMLFDGCSVMLQVVTGTDCASSDSDSSGSSSIALNYPRAPIDSSKALPEKIPILFNIPLLNDPMSECYDLEVEREYRHIILGLGDVIIPGYFIAFCFFIDAVRRNEVSSSFEPSKTRYGITALIGYGFGMVSTFIALKLMKFGQPALIYLVPCTLFPIIIYAFFDGILRELWNGSFCLRLQRGRQIAMESATNS